MMWSIIIPIIAAALAVLAITAGVLYRNLKAAREDADTRFPEQPIGAVTQSCPNSYRIEVTAQYRPCRGG